MNKPYVKKFFTNQISRTGLSDHNLVGAPFKIGDRVTILNNPNNDETFNNQLTFKNGMVVYFEYECGCGQTFPDDPMVGVRFNNGKIEEFWKEEMRLSS